MLIESINTRDVERLVSNDLPGGRKDLAAGRSCIKYDLYSSYMFILGFLTIIFQFGKRNMCWMKYQHIVCETMRIECETMRIECETMRIEYQHMGKKNMWAWVYSKFYTSLWS